jgi:hypothetical protein
MLYTVTKIDVFNELKGVPIFAFIFDSRYSNIIFQDIILDNKTAGVSIVSLPQVTILNKLDPIILVNSSITGNYRIKFRTGEVLFLRIIQIDTQLGNIMFHIFPTNILFLFYFQDIDRIGVKLDNLQNILIQGNKTIPVIRK